MLNILFTRALAAHLPSTVPIVPTAANPGFCFSELRRHLSQAERDLYAVLDTTMGRSAEEGARQLVWAAVGPDGRDGDAVLRLRGAYVSTAAVVALARSGRDGAGPLAPSFGSCPVTRRARERRHGVEPRRNPFPECRPR